MNAAHPVQFSPTGFVPTSEQLDIQLSRHRVTLIEANAGAAKTTTLALRIGEALARGVVPEQILALVFTPAAKEVMKARLRGVGVAYDTAARVKVCTLEEFSREALNKIEDVHPVEVSAAKTLKEFALEAIANVSEHYPDKAELLDIRTHNIAVSQFLECLLQLKATMALGRSEDEVEYVAQGLGIPLTDYLSALEYEELRLGTFDEVSFRGPFDATYDLARLLHEYPETKDDLHTYRLIVGDELHDLNEASFCVLEALLNKDGVYFVGAGDKDQVIYSRLGADAKYLNERFNTSFPHAIRMPLTMTYRHGPQLAYAMEAFKHKPVDSSLPVATPIAELHYDITDADACADQIVAAIKKWKADKHPLEGCAVLLRDRHQSVSIENALMHANLAYRTQDMPSYLRREEILFLRGMTAIALRNLETVKSESVLKAIVESLAIFGEVPLNARELEEAKSTIARDPGTLSFFFKGQIQRVGAEDASARISQAVAYLQDLAPETLAHVALQEVCERIDMQALAKRIYVYPYDAAVIAKSVDGFIAMARKSGLSLREFSEWVGTADAFIDAKKAKNLVLIECVANAKGKEFDHVLMPFLEEGEFPSRLKELKEEENLFYVGATRAKLRLTLLAPTDENQRSHFIKQMKLATINARANAAVQRNRSLYQPVAIRHDLTVSYGDKDIVKGMGAQWDRTRKVWYVPEGVDAGPFKQWLTLQ